MIISQAFLERISDERLRELAAKVERELHEPYVLNASRHQR